MAQWDESLAYAHPRELRARFRRGELIRPTTGMADGFAQANLVVLPKDLAGDFLLFCQRNPKPCPLLEVTEPGQFEPVRTAPGADLRTELPLYRIYRDGRLEGEVTDIAELWREDLVAFLLGCSFTFETALRRADIPLRHIQEDRDVAMYISSIETVPAGPFSGPLVVSMRPILQDKVARAVQVTARYPLAHGAPLHIGEPQAIGIGDLGRPDYGDPIEVQAEEVPVFWACGVTPQAVALKASLPLMITHSPGHMFITDLLVEDMAAP